MFSFRRAFFLFTVQTSIYFLKKKHIFFSILKVFSPTSTQTLVSIATSLCVPLRSCCGFGPLHKAISALHSTLQCIVMHCPALYCTALRYTAMLYNALNCTVPFIPVPYCTRMHWNALLCAALYCTALHFNAFHCTALYCTVLHFAALYFTRLHCCHY